MNSHDILALDFAYLETFTNRTKTAWGSFFCNENQPTYFDANHAHIDRANGNPQQIIDEVVHFYQSRNLIPRIYLYDLVAQKDLITLLKLNHFGYEELIGPVQLWDRKLVEKVDYEGVTIEVVTEDNYSETLAIECSIKEFGGKSVREKAFEHEFWLPCFEHFLLRYHGTACATACIFSSSNQARLESVATLEEYRGRGLIGELIRYIQKVVAMKGIENLWVFPINEKVEKVYQRFGFQTVEKLRMGHAFLGGRSIKVIRGEE